MKRILVNGLLCGLIPILSVTAFAQKTLTEAQYQIDGGDPLPLAVDANASVHPDDQAFTINLDSSDLSIGPHEISVRFKDSDEVWSYWDRSNLHSRWFRVTGKQFLTAAEWFIDSDPGEGNGTPIPVPDDGTFDGKVENLTIDTIDSKTLSIGMHTLYIRCKDQDGNWGKTNQCSFEIAPSLIVRAAEWVTDPSVVPGKGNPLKAADGAFDSAEEELISDSLRYDAFPEGTVIYVRVQDDLNFQAVHTGQVPNSVVRGRWSSNGGWRDEAQIVVTRTIEQPTPTPTVTPKPEEPTATPTQPIEIPTPTPVIVIPTPTVRPDDPDRIYYIAERIEILEGDRESLEECGWMEVPGGFDGLKAGLISSQVSLEPNWIESSNDGLGLQFDLSSNSVAMVLTRKSIVSNGHPILLKASFHAKGGNAQIVVGALKGDFSTGQFIDGSLGMSMLRTSVAFNDGEGNVSALFQPDEGDSVTPFIQVSSDSFFGEKVWLDRLEIYRLVQED